MISSPPAGRSRGSLTLTAPVKLAHSPHGNPGIVPGSGSLDATSSIRDTREVLLSIRDLEKSYSGRTVLSGVNVDVRAGEFIAFLGANGSGKSTTLRCVIGLADADRGSIRLDGAELGELHGGALVAARARAAMVFQKIHLVPRRTALENVCAGGLARVSLGRSLHPALYPKELREEAMACLERVGLADRALDRVGRLSGGQQQRVAIARALCQRARVLLADEPVSALDPHAAEQVMALLRELAVEENLAVAAVLHQPDLARRYADRAIGLLGGTIVFDGPVAGLSDQILTELYRPETPE